MITTYLLSVTVSFSLLVGLQLLKSTGTPHKLVGFGDCANPIHVHVCHCCLYQTVLLYSWEGMYLWRGGYLIIMK